MRLVSRLTALLLLLLASLAQGAEPVVVPLDGVGPLLLQAGTKDRGPTARYVDRLVRRDTFPGERDALRAWARAPRDATPLAALREAGRPLIGVYLNASEDLVGPPADKAHRQAFARAIREAEGTPVFLPPDAPHALLDHLDLVIFSGGDDIHPSLYGQPVTFSKNVNLARDRADRKLTRRAIAKGMCVEGVCRGHQMLNVALGGSLTQDLPHAGFLGHQEGHHPVRLAQDSGIAKDLGATRVRRSVTWHHQAWDRVAPALKVVGWSPNGVPEAGEGFGGRVRGYQFHPELSRSRESRAIFAGIVARARAAAARR